VSEPESQSMLDGLRSDHNAIAAQLDDPTATGDTDDGAAVREQLVMELVRHFVAEEQYLYPTIRQHVTDGVALADTGFADDRACEQELKQLEEPDLTAERLAALWVGIRVAFTAHIKQQEPLFTALTAACDPGLLAELGAAVRGAEQLAPTRPRAVASSSATVNKITSLVEGFIDHVRDSYTHRGADARDTP
jgi:hypothetical protein